MSDFKSILIFCVLCCYVLGTIGGIGWTLYNRGYVIAVGVLVLAVLAWPKVVELFKKLRD